MERNEPDAPTPEEIKLLIERAEEKDPGLATLLFVAATTGCRRGELCGLRWSDVDFEKGVLLVRRSVSDLPGRVEIRTTKTGHVRKMALDSATLSVLTLLRKRAATDYVSLGTSLGADAYLWSSSPDCMSPLRPGGVTSRPHGGRKARALSADPDPADVRTCDGGHGPQGCGDREQEHLRLGAGPGLIFVGLAPGALGRDDHDRNAGVLHEFKTRTTQQGARVLSGPPSSDNDQVHRIGLFIHSKQRRAGVPVDHEPFDRGRVHAGVDGYLTDHVLMWSDLSRESRVLQEAHSVDHLQ
jgi:hypothetical protein